MNTKSMRRAWMFGPVLSLSVALASCNGPVPVGNNVSGGSGNGSGSGAGSGSGTGTGAPINLDPGATSTVVTTGTEVTEQQACSVSSNQATKQADILLVLDRSTSMNYAMDSNSQCGGGIGGGVGRRSPDAGAVCQARWPAMKTALTQVLTTSADAVNWGLEFFSTPNKGNCAVSGDIQVPIKAGNATAITTAIGNASPGGYTPTRKGIAAAVTYLQKLAGGESKSILLATDGQPNCLGDSENTTDDVEGTKAAIKAASDAGFKVYILGIGPEASTEALNGFAEAGGTAVKNVSGTGKNYYAALSAEELAKQFESIVSSVASCTFSLTPPKNADLSNVVVEFDGDKAQRASLDTSHKNGWDFTSDSHTGIQLYGSWCDGLMNGTYKAAKVLIGCKNQPIP